MHTMAYARVAAGGWIIASSTAPEMTEARKWCAGHTPVLLNLVVVFLLFLAMWKMSVFNGARHVYTSTVSNAFPSVKTRSAGSDTTAWAQQYLQLMEMALTGSLQDEAGQCNMAAGCPISQLLPFDPAKRKVGGDWPPFGHTMVGHMRLQNIKALLKAVVANNTPGHFVELGIWRGGATIYARAVLNVLQQPDRRVYAFDAFEVIPGYGLTKNFLQNSEAAVRHNFEKYGVMNSTNVVLVKGLFRDSVPAFRKANPDLQLAVLRIDANFYDSTQDVLYNLYELVPVGGFVIFDDIRSHEAVRAAWDDFMTAHTFSETLEPVDWTCAYFQKTVSVKVNLSKMQPPRDANQGANQSR